MIKNKKKTSLLRKKDAQMFFNQNKSNIFAVRLKKIKGIIIY